MQTRFVEFAVNQTYDLEFVQSQSGVLKGTLRDSGENAVESAKVMAQLITGGSYAEAHTDSDGSYRLEGLISGTYQVTVMPHGESTLLPVQRNGVIVRDGGGRLHLMMAAVMLVTDPTGTAQRRW